MPLEKRITPQRAAEITPEEQANALYYLAATLCYPKEIRDAGDTEAERRELSKLTLSDVLANPESLEQPMKKMVLLLAGGHHGTIKHMAHMWTSTHQEKPKDVGELK